MIWLEILLAAMALCSVVPALLFAANLKRYRAPHFGAGPFEPLTVLIPARDEELNIRACVESVLASRELALEVIVCDDDSADRTAKIVLEMAALDRRVHLLRGDTLPPGWNGKQHACYALAEVALTPMLLFLDADVRLGPWALARCLAERRRRDVALLSGFPRQVTSGWLDALLLPLIHFILLAYLPFSKMQSTTKPEFAAGCGQFFLVDREAYFKTGGHAAIRTTRHDGLQLPRLFREFGFRTDLVDLTRLADVRMYATAAATWSGLAKNATEGMASPTRIVPFTVLLLLGQVFPPVAVILFARLMFSMLLDPDASQLQTSAIFLLLMALSLAASLVPRLAVRKRFQQPTWSAWLHPFGVGVLLLVQWWALLLQAIGKPVKWRTRSYAE